jgi:IPT/TIG domain-containing protein
MMRTVIFGYDLLVVLLLAVLAVLYFRYVGTQPSDEWLKLLQQYQLPLKCLWFGALGGTVISLKGVYDHPVSASAGWNSDFDLWHFGRPVSGAITGVITFVLLHVINPSTDPSAPVLYAAAFILGTQEARFFNFLYEVGRIIVQVPEQKTAGLKVTDVQPSKGTAGQVLVVAGQGFVPAVTVTLDGAALTGLSVASDGAAVAGIIPAGTAGKTVDLVVTNPDGATVTLHNKFTYA